MVILNEPSQPWIEVYEYPSAGKRYFRLQWGKGHTVDGYKHIPGGNSSKPKVQARATEVGRHLRQGASIDQLLRLIESWSKRRH